MIRSNWRLLFLLSLIPLLLTGCGKPFISALNPQGPVAREQYSLIILSILIMTLVIVVVVIIYVYVLLKFREKPGQAGYPEQVEGSHKLEITWTVIPIILIIILAIPTVLSTFNLSESHPGSTPEAAAESDALLIKVTAHQYWWEIEYPDYGIVTAQDIYIPTGERVYFEVTAKDVIHSFWVPSLGGKIDANPGLTNHIYLEAEKPGVYHGKCAELCGPSHALMDFKVIALEPTDFENWLATMSDYNDAPQTALAEQGRAIFDQSCIACHATDGATKSPYPNLAGLGDREALAGYLKTTPENLKRWIENPEEVKEGNLMPSATELGLSEQDVDALVEYLMQLKLN